MRIFLIGFMGSGKTTLGKAFARAMQLQFIDLDWYIEERFHKTVQELFAERGEEGFREIERRMLHEVGEFEDVIIAAGGGTPCFFDNIQYMNRVGKTVFLDVVPEVLFRRLKIAKSKRPLLAGKDDAELMSFILSALEKRKAFYEQADYCFDAQFLESREQIADSVAAMKNLLDKE